MNQYESVNSLKNNVLNPFVICSGMSKEDDIIISFESPYKLQEFGIGKPESAVLPEHVIDQQMFNIRLVNTEKRREKASLLIHKNIHGEAIRSTEI